MVSPDVFLDGSDDGNVPLDEFTTRSPGLSDELLGAMRNLAKHGLPEFVVTDGITHDSVAPMPPSDATLINGGGSRHGANNDGTGLRPAWGKSPLSGTNETQISPSASIAGPDGADGGDRQEGTNTRPEEIIESPAADAANGGVVGPPEQPPAPPGGAVAPDGDGGDKSERIVLDQGVVNARFADIASDDEAYDHGGVRAISRPDGSGELNFTDGDFSVSLFKGAPRPRLDAAESYEAAVDHNRPPEEQSGLYMDMLLTREEQTIARDAYDAARARWDEGDDTVTPDDLLELGSAMCHAISAVVASADKYIFNTDTVIRERWPDGLYANGVLVPDASEHDAHIPERPVFGTPSNPSAYTSELDPEECKELGAWDLYRGAQYHSLNRQYGDAAHVLAALEDAVVEINDHLTSVRVETIAHEDAVLRGIYGRGQWLQNNLRERYEERRTGYLTAVAEVAAASNHEEAQAASQRLYYAESAFRASIEQLYDNATSVAYELPPDE